MAKRREVQSKQKGRKAAAKTAAKRGRGRPHGYRPEFCEHATKLARLGLIGPQLAQYFGISEDTLYRWMREFPDFSEAVKKGREESDREVAEALYHRARGWQHKAVKMFQHDGRVITEDYIEKFPPDVAACIFWLKNRQPHLWRDKQEMEHSGSIDISDRLQRALERTRADGQG